MSESDSRYQLPAPHHSGEGTNVDPEKTEHHDGRQPDNRQKSSIGMYRSSGQGRVREGSGVGFWVRLFVRVSLQGLYGRVSFKG